MSNEIDWFSSMARRRVTVTEIGKHLGVTRRTATNRLNEGLTADELITVSKALDLSPIHALVELGKISAEDVFDFVDGDGKLLSTATAEELLFQLAKENLPVSALIDLGNDGRDRVAKMEESKSTRKSYLEVVSDASDIDDGTVKPFDYGIPHAADSSIDEDAERESRGEDLID